MSSSAISSTSTNYIDTTTVSSSTDTTTTAQNSFAQILQNTSSSNDATQTTAMQQWSEDEWKTYLYLPSPGSMLQYMQEKPDQASDMQKWSQQQWVEHAYGVYNQQPAAVVSQQPQESVSNTIDTTPSPFSSQVQTATKAVAAANVEPVVTEAPIATLASSVNRNVQTDTPMQQWNEDTWQAYLYLPSPGSMLQYMQENQELSAAMEKWSQEQWVDYAYNQTSLKKETLIQA